MEACKLAGFEIEDLEHEGYIGFIDALKEYNKQPTDYKFVTFITRPLLTKLLDAIGMRTVKGRHDFLKTCRRLEELIPGADGEDLTLGNTITDETAVLKLEQVEDSDKYNILMQELDNIKPQCSEVIKQHFFHGKTYKSIGDEMKLTRERIRQLSDKGLRDLRRSKLINDCYYEEYGLHCTGLSSFKRTGTSSTEWAVIKLNEYNQAT